MGLSVWYFLRPRAGEWLPVARRAMDEFLSETGRLAADAEGFVRLAQVTVKLESRRATEVLHVGLFQHRALEDGRLDREHLDEIMRTVPEAASGSIGRPESTNGVVNAEHRFAQRRLEHLSTWKPTAGELAKLRSLVN